MDVPVSDAKARLTDLVKRAEAGKEVVLTRFGRPVVKLVAARPEVTMQARRAVMEDVRRTGARKVLEGPSAARSQDFLYDEFGFPN